MWRGHQKPKNQLKMSKIIVITGEPETQEPDERAPESQEPVKKSKITAITGEPETQEPEEKESLQAPYWSYLRPKMVTKKREEVSR